MVTRQSLPLGAPNWIDLTTSDPERAQQFYGAVFGWTFETGGPESRRLRHRSRRRSCGGGADAQRPAVERPRCLDLPIYTADAEAGGGGGHGCRCGVIAVG